ADGRSVSPLVEDPARLPEIAFQQPLARDLPPEKAQEQTALTIARINHLNKEKSDSFMEALLEARPDLSGLPVAMGEACRSTGERSREFKHAVSVVRQALQPSGSAMMAVADRRLVEAQRALAAEHHKAMLTRIAAVPQGEPLANDPGRVAVPPTKTDKPS